MSVNVAIVILWKYKIFSYISLCSEKFVKNCLISSNNLQINFNFKSLEFITNEYIFGCATVLSLFAKIT